jgi:antitoxin CptB
MNKDNDTKSYLIKKLLYQSNYRGCKETDLILGRFAMKYLNSFNDQQLTQFETILSLPDADIYDWYTNRKPAPDSASSDVLTMLLQFDPTHS